MQLQILVECVLQHQHARVLPQIALPIGAGTYHPVFLFAVRCNMQLAGWPQAHVHAAVFAGLPDMTNTTAATSAIGNCRPKLMQHCILT